MIRYNLKCRDAHTFESWFRSASAFEDLRERRQLVCPECASTQVEKALMSPRVGASEARPPAVAREHPLAALRREIEANSDYVGADFAREARAMHDGTVARRTIHGEARPFEARRLIEDGIPVAPLPFIPKAKVN